MLVPSPRPCFVSFLIGYFFLASETNAAVQCSLSSPVLVSNSNGELYLQQVKNSAEGTYSMKWTFIGEPAWIGVGINSQGQAKMTPSDAVVGRVNNDGVSTSVRYYSLSSDSEDASGVQPHGSSTLQGATFEQPDDTTSILTFTQDLAEMGITDSSTWIYAVGLPGNQWAGKHKISGSFQMALTENCQEVAEPAQSPTTPADEDPTGTTSTSVSQTQPPNAPDAAPTLAPEDDSSSTATSGTVLVDTTDPGNALSGLTSQNAEANGFVILDTTKPYQNLWIAHGICLATAWGIFVPLAIGASILRSTLQKRLGHQSWYYLHYYFNLVGILLTLLGFLFGVVAVSKEGEEHFTDNTHTRVGLTIMILVVVQGLAGYLRPPAPAKSPTKTSTSRGSVEDEESADESREVVLDKQNQNPEDSSSKPLKRVVWEWSHRSLGIFLVALAWYNCNEGINQYLQDWEDSKDWTWIFWGTTISIVGSILLLSCVMRLNKQN